MILEVQHETTMAYSAPVGEWRCELRMEPINDAGQRCHSFQLNVSQPATIHRYRDGFGNRVHHFNLLQPQQTIRLLAASIVETEDAGIGPMASQAVFPADTESLPLETLEYLSLRGPVAATMRLGPHLEQLRPRAGLRIGMWVCQVAEYIRGNFEYARDVTDSGSPIDHLLQYGKGVCQDFTHLMIAILRRNGVPARYVSGYIHRGDRDSQSHAWCEVWLPDLGWSGFDPTNGCPINGHFAKTAIGRDFTDVPPNKGVYRGSGVEQIDVRVGTRVLERLPSLAWHDQLPPLDVPVQSVVRTAAAGESLFEEQQQQQQ